MPESIQLHFRSASSDEVLSRITTVAETLPGLGSYFPSNANYLLRISTYEDYALEYDATEKSAVELLLEASPACSLDIELRRSRSNAACDAALEILTMLSDGFTFVVDDNCFRLWSSKDALGDPRFLAEYRQDEQTN